MRRWLMLAVLTITQVAPDPAQAYVFGSASINETLNFNIVDVCAAGAGGATIAGSCAPAGNIQTYVNYANAAFAQTGIAFAAGAVTQLALPVNAGCGVGGPAEFCTDGLLSSSRDLVNTPGHGQSTVDKTLNVYLVNSLVTSGSAAYGWGLIGGNGVLLMTGTNPTTGKTAALDSLAHELGHNLGLDHVDQTNDLMFSGSAGTSRVTPLDVCQLPPYSCVPAGTATPAVAPQAVTAGAVSKVTLTATTSVGVTPGMLVAGAGIPAGDTVATFDPVTQTVTLAKPLIGTVVQDASLQFSPQAASVNVVANTTVAAAGTVKLALAATTGLSVGMEVAGTGIPAGATVVSMDSVAGTVTLSAPLTGPVTAGAALQFAAPLPAANTTTSVAGVKNAFTLTLASAGGLTPGMAVTGSNIPAGNTIVLVNGNTITLAEPLSGAVALNSPIKIYAVPTVQNAGGTIGTSALKLTSTGGIAPGMVLAGSGIPAGDTVATVDPITNIITLTAPLTGTVLSTSPIKVFAPPTIVGAAAAATGAAVLQLNNASGVTAGMVAAVPGVPANDIIVSVDHVANTVTLASPLVGTVAANAPVTLSLLPKTDLLTNSAVKTEKVAVPEAVAGTVSTAAAAGTSTLTMSAATLSAGVVSGMGITGSGIAAGAQVVSVDPVSHIVTLSAPLAGAVAANAAVQFASSAVTLNSTEGVVPGMTVTGTGIPANTLVVAVDPVTRIATFTRPLSAAVALNASLQFISPQVTTVQNAPLLTELPGVTVAVPGVPQHMFGGDPGCDPLSSFCYAAAGNTATTGPLIYDVKYRFADPGVTLVSATAMMPIPYIAADGSLQMYTGSDGNPVDLTGAFTSRPAGTGVEWVLKPATPFPALAYFDVTFNYPSIGHNPAGAGLLYNYSPPFSSAFDFTNGLSSRGGYDGSGFSSSNGEVFGLDPSICIDTTGYTCATNVPFDPMRYYLIHDPVTGAALPPNSDIDHEGVSPNVIALAPQPFAGQDVPSGAAPVRDVPEPMGITLLLSALGGLAAARRRRGQLDLRPALTR